MATARCLLSEDEFQCSICLDVFTDPVSTPCGHNFCKTCITQHWDVNDRYLCPMCQKIYKSRPELHTNTLLSKMASQFREEVQQEARIRSSEQQPSNPGEVPCDVCTGTKLKALKSCLVCLESYCEPHLEPHLTRPGLKRHELMDPVENLEERICMKHTKPLELFCKTDQIGVCTLCSVLDHKTHDVVPLKEEYEEKKAELGKTEAEIQQMIQNRQLKIQEIADSADLSKENADKEKAEGVQVFIALKESVEKGLKEFINTIDKKQKTTEKQAEDFIKELEEEIYDLTTRRDEVALLSQSEDQLHLLQSFKSLKAATPYQDWTERSVHPPSRGGTLMKAAGKLEEKISKEIKKVLIELELKRIQQYAVDVTFDPDTKGPKTIPGVLGKQSFSSGRFYFEVQVKDDTEWTLGVVKESVNRKGKVTLSPRNGHWTIYFRNGTEAKANEDPPVRLSLETRPKKVGVFVDYEEDLVSFYDVDTAALIYSFTGCSFTDKLLPFFIPCPLLVQKEKMAEGRAADLDTQRIEMAELLETTLKKGDTWYLVDSRWFLQWKKYVGYDNRDKYQKGDQNVFPGPVDNSGLLRDWDVLDIKEHLIDELEYVLVPTVGWTKLVSWYGLTEGQEPIARKVVEQGLFVKYCKVEVYLTQLQLCENSNMDKMITRRFSKADTIDMIEKEMRKVFNIPDQKETKLWNKYMSNTFEHLNRPDSTVQEAGLYQRQVIVIGQKNKDGSWPRVSRAPK